jgi:glycosyltransferase involved in cell wall biosynthesis
MKRKKILIDLSALKNIYCGLGQVALNYAAYFKQYYSAQNSDYQLFLLVPKSFFGQFGHEVKYISSSNWLHKHCKYCLPKFDIWHATHQLSRFNPASKSTKYILTIHDLNFLYEKTGKELAKNLRRIKRKVARADEIICISQFVKNEVESHLDLHGKNCQIIVSGVEKIDEKTAQKPNFDVKKPFFFSVGVVREKKNYHVLLDCMKLFPDRQLYIAGDTNSEYADLLAQQIENEKINNVTLLGKIPQQEKIWYYANCQAFLFPSLFEGFGLPVVEALQFGKPVFTSTKTSLKEIGSKYVAFWENFEPHYMKQVIDNYLIEFQNSPEKIQEAKAYGNSFLYKKHLEEYLKLYRTFF